MPTQAVGVWRAARGGGEARGCLSLSGTEPLRTGRRVSLAAVVGCSEILASCTSERAHKGFYKGGAARQS